ncbi:hypothetical protein OJAV_G00200150 [Oryzias javanicus]|uniref:Uncharacterized protein n=1 Tax=Oryzias javanicus TaxID=123683 RepID=A0A3S2M2X3_ORYJA|nr:hypothetical protein OJAV_G00200150 [Oryzias javanicus]
MSEKRRFDEPAGARRFNGILVNYLTEEGYYVLRKLTPEELYQVICDLRDEPTEIRLSQLKEKLSQQSLDEAVDSIIQEVYNDENKPLDPFRIEDSRYIRGYTWRRVKKLYKKMKLFNTADEKAEMSKPTPREARTRRLKKSWLKGEKTEKEAGFQLFSGV